MIWKKNGFTAVDLLITIIVVGVVSFFAINKLSYAFESNTEEAYQNQVKLIIKQAAKYGETIKEQLKEEPLITTVNELVSKGYIGANEEGKVMDLRNESKDLNSLQVKIMLEEETVKAALVE